MNKYSKRYIVVKKTEFTKRLMTIGLAIIFFCLLIIVSIHFIPQRGIVATATQEGVSGGGATDVSSQSEVNASSLPDSPYGKVWESIGTRIVTAYSEYDSCHTGKSCLMASGKKAYIGAIACPRYLRLSTRVVIDKISYICEDRTSLIYDGRFDIFMGYGQESHDKSIQYGIKRKEVKIYEKTGME